MTQDVELGCRCGEVHGWLRGVSPQSVNRAICHCQDCQAFLHYLGRAELLDAQGGTDIVQVAPRTVSFDRGLERIAGVKLAAKGMYRWYASCCKTPLGNTLTPSVPFIGIPPGAFRGTAGAEGREAVFGQVRGRVFGQHAIGAPPPGSTRTNWRMLAHTARLLLGWKLGGAAWPHPFFDRAAGAPSHPVTTLSADERAALRPLCGPKASIGAAA